MTKKEFAKWQKENPITFYDGANGLTGTITINGFSYSVCSRPDKNKRFQRSDIKERLTARIKEVLEIED